MKVNASCAPNKNFRVEEIPDKPGFALARFFENVVENEKKIDDKTIKEYNYDEYGKSSNGKKSTTCKNSWIM